MSDDTEKPDPRLANLAPPFPPGVSGNPAGRRKGSLNRATIYRRLLEMAAIPSVMEEHRRILGDEIASSAVTVAEQIAAKDLIKALAGEEGAMARVFDNVEGKLAETLNTNIGVKGILGELDKRGPDPLPKLSKPDASCSPKKLPIPKPKTPPPSQG